VRTWYAQAGLPTRLTDLPDTGSTAEDLIALMRQDKKAKGGKPSFVLARGIGQALVANDVDLAQVKSLLTTSLDRSPAASTKI
jgi:3-dehydroquinate synthetase